MLLLVILIVLSPYRSVSGSYLPFALSGTQDQTWKSCSRKYYTTILLATRPCCSSEFIESFLFWVILVTYNVGIFIRMYIYKVSYICSFFVIFNSNVFSALHAKHFEIRKNVLWNSTIHQVMWYFWVFTVNSFCLLWSIFLSQEDCVSFGLLVSCLSQSQSA